MQPNFIIFSDMHYTKGVQKSIPDTEYLTSWFKTQVDITNQIFTYAANNDVEIVIHNGDLFESKNRIDQALYNKVWDLYREYSNQFRIIFNSGNHDLLTLSRQSSLRPFSNIISVIKHPATFYVDEYEFRFLPYGMIGDLSLELNIEYSKHILFVHEDISSLTYGSVGTKSNSRIDPEIFKEWDIVFNGHIHKPQQIANIISIGSPAIVDWGEAGEEKRFIHFFNGKIKSIPLNCPKFVHFTGFSSRIRKVIETNNTDFFRIEVSAEELSDPIFKKYNVYPHVTKSLTRELRLVDSLSDGEDIEKYLEIVETNLDKGKLEEIGKEIINGII